MMVSLEQSAGWIHPRWMSRKKARTMAIIKPEDLPPEFDIREHGFVMRGWDFSRKEMAAAINAGRMLNVTFEGMSNYCPWNCDYCYTERDASPEAEKRRLATELPLVDRLRIISEAAALGARSMNFIGAGEPTLDPNFWEIVGHTASLGLTPIVFTEASFRLTDDAFVQKLYDLGATVVIKVNSLRDRVYQESVVAGETNGKRAQGYFDERNHAIMTCQMAGFARCTPTRFGFDTIITRRNLHDIKSLHFYARMSNIFLVLKNFLRTGRVKNEREDALSNEEQAHLWQTLREQDRDRFGIKQSGIFPFGGSHPCTLRSTGVHISIEGKVFRCDGEEDPLGDLRTESLADVWARVRHIDQNVMGLCPPRERHWAKTSDGHRRLPVIP